MEVDGAGKYLSLIPSFKSDISTDECKYFLLCCVFWSRIAVSEDFAV